MTAQSLAIRKKLHQFIDTVEEKRLKAMYTIFEDEIKNYYSGEFINMLNERREEYRRTGKAVSRKESQKRIGKLLRSIK